MKVIGKITICMEMEFINGQMGAHTKDNLIVIKNMVMVNTCIQMADVIKVYGKMASKMVKEHSHSPMESKDKAYGKKAKEKNG